jgi:hypothetical protein
MYNQSHLLNDDELRALASNMEDMGRYGDSRLVHVNENELRVLKQMGSGTRNPQTGLLEFFDDDGSSGDDYGSDGFAGDNDAGVGGGFASEGNSGVGSGSGMSPDAVGENDTTDYSDLDAISAQFDAMANATSFNTDMAGNVSVAGTDAYDQVASRYSQYNAMTPEQQKTVRSIMDRAQVVQSRGWFDVDVDLEDLEVRDFVFGVMPFGSVFALAEKAAVTGLNPNETFQYALDTTNNIANQSNSDDYGGGDGDVFNGQFKDSTTPYAGLNISANYVPLKIAPSGYAQTQMLGEVATRNPGFRKYDYSKTGAPSERTAPTTGISATDMISWGPTFNQAAYSSAQRATNAITDLVAKTGQEFYGNVDIAYDRKGNLRVKIGNGSSSEFANSDEGFAAMIDSLSKAVTYGIDNNDRILDGTFVQRSGLYYQYKDVPDEELSARLNELVIAADVAQAAEDTDAYTAVAGELYDVRAEMVRRTLYT